MVTARYAFFLVLLSLFGCKSTSYLPNPTEVGTSTHGAYIQSYLKNGKRFSGELIAVDSFCVTVLSEKDQQCNQYPTQEIDRYSLRYAKSKNYGWTIPVFSLMSFLHGYFAVVTFPINLVTTISVTVGAKNAFVYKKRHMPMEKLHMFARFPQGLPEGLALTEIK